LRSSITSVNSDIRKLQEASKEEHGLPHNHFESLRNSELSWNINSPASNWTEVNEEMTEVNEEMTEVNEGCTLESVQEEIVPELQSTQKESGNTEMSKSVDNR
jgi:hypothetical protein